MAASRSDDACRRDQRLTPLGPPQHLPYFHDGSAPDLLAVVNHYDTLFHPNLTAEQKADLVEYLKTLLPSTGFDCGGTGGSRTIGAKSHDFIVI
jgi:hypothetical protein